MTTSAELMARMGTCEFFPGFVRDVYICRTHRSGVRATLPPDKEHVMCKAARSVGNGYRKIDDREAVEKIVEFWDRKAASRFETSLLELFCVADEDMLTRLALVFPEAVHAWAAWKSHDLPYQHGEI